LALERDGWKKIVEEAKAYLRAVEPREEEEEEEEYSETINPKKSLMKGI
jgi:hypothetical protein